MKKNNKIPLKNTTKIHYIDAQGKILGRLASEVALLLRGKTSSNFQPNQLPSQKVILNNIDKIKITGKKIRQKEYYHFTGYPGGIKKQRMSELWQKNPALLFKKVIYYMLPKNKLRKKMIKNLIIKK